MRARWIYAFVLACACGACFWPQAAHAHKPSDSYLTLTVQPAGRLDVNWHIALRDLDTEMHLDRNDDGQLTWGEVRPQWASIIQFARPHLTLSHGDQTCTVVPPLGAEPTPQIDTHTDGRYAVLRWTLQCPIKPGQSWQSVNVDYRLFALTDPTHRGIVHLHTADTADTGTTPTDTTVVLGTQRPTHELTFNNVPGSPTTETWWQALARFVHDGVHHIAIGSDHILFLLSLLLVSVWQRSGPRSWWPLTAGWHARADWRPALTEVLKLITAFTLAHSLTLSLATLGVVSPPSRWVESLIALSVLLAAIDNLLPLLHAPRWTVVFAFGLVHGFGFAGALQDLGLSRGNLAVPLLGFNLGVELGQLALVSVALPVMLLLRRTALYRWLFVTTGSVLIAAMALVWLIERMFDITIALP